MDETSGTFFTGAEVAGGADDVAGGRLPAELDELEPAEELAGAELIAEPDDGGADIVPNVGELDVPNRPGELELAAGGGVSTWREGLPLEELLCGLARDGTCWFTVGRDCGTW